MDAIRAIESRKSVRDYTPQAVEETMVETLVKAAASAPKAGELHLCVVSNRELLQKINDAALEGMKSSGNAFLMERAALPGYRPLYGAPLMLAFSTAKDTPYGLANASNAATTVCLAATALGLGSCYVITPTLALGGDPELAKALGVPAECTTQCCVLVGYAGEDVFAAPRQGLSGVEYCR